MTNRLRTEEEIEAIGGRLRAPVGPDEWIILRDVANYLLHDVRVYRGHAEAYREALQWCGGSADFAPDGQAHEGWMKLVRPLLDR